MDEYGLSPDELIATDSRRLHSSRRDYRPYSKRDWIAAIKKVYKRDEQVFAGFLQEKHQQLYHQGTWLFGDWDKAPRSGICSRTDAVAQLLGQGESYPGNMRPAKAKLSSSNP
jgi:hypothetical protein